MTRLIIRGTIQMVVIMAVVSFMLFAIFDSDDFKRNVAISELGGFGTATMSEQDYQAWLNARGLNVPFATRYINWLSEIVSGHFGRSIEKNMAVSTLIRERLSNTAILAACVFAIMIPVSLTFGVLAGIREGSALDRVISFLAVLTTSIPQIATAVLLTVFLALGLGWVPAKSAMSDGWDVRQLILPVLTLVIYDIGYVVRMTRASMIEVMTSNYIRTATLKGLPRSRIILRHALRNALIVPFTLIFLQLNWLLSQVVVVEVFFQYRGFGSMLFDATVFGDFRVVQAATLVAVFVAVVSQLLSDISYAFLNPRVRFG